ncbi:MAG: PRC-barrel domain-containing protein [Chthoniobacterales bacterium]
MKRLIRNTLALCLGFGLAASVGSTQAGDAMQGKLLKASEVIGAKIFDTDGEHRGEIKDLVFDENKGGIVYGVLSIGGWLGIGEDVTVVPWKEIKQSKSESPGFVVSNMDKTKLQGAPHFGNDSWPDFNGDWNNTTATYYGLQGDKLKGMKLVRASNVREAKLWNQSAEKIGSISDLLVALHDGKIAYGILEVGEWANQGDKLVAVPWELIRQSESASPGYVLNVEKSKLNPQTFFEKDTWPNYNDRAWNTQTYGYYNTSPYWDQPFVY